MFEPMHLMHGNEVYVLRETHAVAIDVCEDPVEGFFRRLVRRLVCGNCPCRLEGRRNALQA